MALCRISRSELPRFGCRVVACLTCSVFAVVVVVLFLLADAGRGHGTANRVGRFDAVSRQTNRRAGSASEFGFAARWARHSQTADRDSVAEVQLDLVTETPESALRSLAERGGMAGFGDEMRRIAEQVAWKNPVEALAYAAVLPPSVQPEFLQVVVGLWEQSDLDGLLNYLEAAPSPDLLAMLSQRTAIISPDRLLDLVQQGDPRPADELAVTAILAIAASDPDRAMARIDSVRQLPAPRQLVLLAMLGNRFPDQALDLIERLPVGAGTVPVVLAAAMIQTQGSGDGPGTLADSLLARDGSQTQAMLRAVLAEWVRIDPERAAVWLSANRSSIDPDIRQRLLRALATDAPQSAVAYLERLPMNLRDDTIPVVARAWAGHAPDAALAWVSEKRGQSGFAATFRTIISEAALHRPAEAGRVLAESKADVQLGAAPTVAAVWTRQDPSMAAKWAGALANPTARRLALDRVAMTWSRLDSAAAGNWVLGLEPGSERDAALTGFVAAAAVSGDLDWRYLEAYSVDASRERALIRALPTVALRNTDAARSLADRFVSTPALRHRTAEIIDSFAADGQ